MAIVEVDPKAPLDEDLSDAALDKPTQPSRPAFGTHPSPEQPAAMRGLGSTVPNPVITQQQSQFSKEERANQRLGMMMALSTAAAPVAAAIPATTLKGMAASGGLNLALEGVDKGVAALQGHPEEGPSPTGAGVRSLGAALIPATIQKGAELIAPAARVTKEILRDTLGQKFSEMLDTLWRKPPEGAELAAGQRAVKAVKGQVRTLSPQLPLRNQIIKDAEAAGGSLPPQEVDALLANLRGAYPGKVLAKYQSAKQELAGIAKQIDKETLSNGVRQPLPLTRVHDLVQQFQEPLFQQSGSQQVSKILGELQAPLNKHLSAEIGRTLGPDAAQEFAAMQKAIGERAQAIKGVKGMVKVPRGQEAVAPVKVATSIKKVLDPNSKESVLLQDFQRTTQIPLYDEMKKLALKRAWNPSDVEKYGWFSIIASRVAGGAFGAYVGGEQHRGLGTALGFLMGDPRFARPLVKVLLTTEVAGKAAAPALNTLLRDTGQSQENP